MKIESITAKLSGSKEALAKLVNALEKDFMVILNSRLIPSDSGGVYAYYTIFPRQMVEAQKDG